MQFEPAGRAKSNVLFAIANENRASLPFVNLSVQRASPAGDGNQQHEFPGGLQSARGSLDDGGGMFDELEQACG